METMQFAVISTDGDVLAFFDEIEEAYAAADETPESDLVALTASGLPVPPPSRTVNLAYGSEATTSATIGLSGGYHAVVAPALVPAS